MSSVVLSDYRFSRSEETSPVVGVTVSSAARAASEQTLTSRPYSAYESSPALSRERNKRGHVTSRRFQGIVTQNTGETWQVDFVENGKAVPFHVPAKNLREVGVTLLNQPFEMDELVPTEPGMSGKWYKFRPLAQVGDAFVDSIALDPERKRKRAFILSRLVESKA